MQIKHKALVGALGATAVGTAVALTGASSAYFTDVEKTTGNSIAAGSLDLVATYAGDGVNNGKISVAGLAPGGPAKTFTVTVKSAGDVHGILRADVANLVDNENGRTDAEVEAGDATSDNGELSQWVNLSISGAPTMKLAQAANYGPMSLGNLTGQKVYSVAVSLPADAPSTVMTDSATFDVDLSLSQQ
jgi:predicted ribosomally synthesized peptide with SipW-like signal peptide